jgi:hypothetical protein
MSFADKPFSMRIQTMGDIAERRFEEESAVKWVRYGLCRPPINMSALPIQLRYTPDYLTAQGLVEVQGLGRDQILKVKHEKLEALRWWEKVHPVYLFVYDSHKDRSSMLSLSEVRKKCKLSETDEFPEGKSYYAIKSSLLWEDVEESIS